MAPSLFGSARHFFQQQPQHFFTPLTVECERELRTQQTERALEVDALSVYLEREVLFARREHGQGFRETELFAWSELALLFVQDVEHLRSERVRAEQGQISALAKPRDDAALFGHGG